MKKIEKLVVFSENRDTRGLYISYGNMKEITPYFKEKNKGGLQILSEEKFDLVLIEIMSPVMSEIEYVDQVYALAKGAPIVIISSYFFDTKDIVFGDKIQSFVMKPFDLDKLIKGINDALESIVEEVIIPSAEAQIAKAENVLYETKKLSVLLEISRSISSISNFDELLQHIVELAADTINAERATLFLVDKKNKQLWSRSGIGIEIQEIRFPIDRGIAGEVALSGEAQIIDEPYKHPKFNKEVDIKTGFVTRNMLCMPMKHMNEDVIGVFQMLNKKDGQFTQEDQVFLNAMATNTGIVLENALLHEEVKKHLAEIKQSYDDLYIAQNQILKESRFVTYSEIVGYIADVFKNANQIQKITDEVRKVYAADRNLQKPLDMIEQILRNAITSIKNFMEVKNKELKGG